MSKHKLKYTLQVHGVLQLMLTTFSTFSSKMTSVLVLALRGRIWASGHSDEISIYTNI